MMHQKKRPLAIPSILQPVEIDVRDRIAGVLAFLADHVAWPSATLSDRSALHFLTGVYMS